MIYTHTHIHSIYMHVYKLVFVHHWQWHHCRFFTQLRDVTREQLVAYVERSLELHPELRDILPSGGDGLEPPSPPARDDAPPWCHCGRCREMPRPEEQLCCRRRDGPCILQTAQRDIYAVVLGRNVLLVAIRHMNDLLPMMSSQETIVTDMPPTDNMSYGDSTDLAMGIEWYSQAVLFGQ